MAEETRAAEGQESTSGEGQEPTGEAKGEETPQGNPAEGANAETLQGNPTEGDSDLLVPKAELNKKNKEAESLRKRLRQFEKAEEERRREQLSQTEQLKEENETLNSKLQGLETQVKRANFERAFGLPDADLAWGMLGDLGIEADFDDELRVTNMDEIIKVAKKQKPRIWGNGSANGGERSDPPEPQGGDFVNSLFRGGRTSPRTRR